MLLTIRSGYLAGAGMHYFDAAKDDVMSSGFATCSGCTDNSQIIDAYSESLRNKMQVSLQDMIFYAGIGIFSGYRFFDGLRKSGTETPSLFSDGQRPKYILFKIEYHDEGVIRISYLEQIAAHLDVA